jgi:hypothetical protein
VGLRGLVWRSVRMACTAVSACAPTMSPTKLVWRHCRRFSGSGRSSPGDFHPDFAPCCVESREEPSRGWAGLRGWLLSAPSHPPTHLDVFGHEREEGCVLAGWQPAGLAVHRVVADVHAVHVVGRVERVRQLPFARRGEGGEQGPRKLSIVRLFDVHVPAWS